MESRNGRPEGQYVFASNPNCVLRNGSKEAERDGRRQEEERIAFRISSSVLRNTNSSFFKEIEDGCSCVKYG